MPSHPRICPTPPRRAAPARAAPARAALARAAVRLTTPILIAALTPTTLTLTTLPAAPPAHAQFALPAPSPPPEAAKQFQNQCGTCHTLSASEPIRQGPPLGGVVGRPAGTVPGFKYSAGLAAAGFTWDVPHLDAWLTNPQAVIPGAVMAYRQANPATRKQIIDWLKDQH
jgi:cytochrome c